MTVRTFVRLIALALLLVATPAIMLAQYTVKEGDTLWRLSGDYLDDPMKWGEVIGANPFLKEAGRQFSLPDGRIVLKILPGEILRGLDDLGIKAEPVPIDQLKHAEQAKPVEPIAPIMPIVVASTAGYQSPVLWLLLVLLAIAIAYAVWRSRQAREANDLAVERSAGEVRMAAAQATALRERETREIAAAHERELTRDPVTSGLPFVPGGIPASQPEILTQFFERQAIARYADRHPAMDRNSIRVEQVGAIAVGTIAGEGEVGYLSGTWRPRRIDTPIPAYQARFRYPDGTEEVLQSLVGCMNPIRNGGEVMRGFIFTPNSVILPAEQPEPVNPAPAAEPAAPELVVRTVVEQHEPGVVRLEIRRATDEQPAMIRITGVDETADHTVELRKGSIMLRYITQEA